VEVLHLKRPSNRAKEAHIVIIHRDNMAKLFITAISRCSSGLTAPLRHTALASQLHPRATLSFRAHIYTGLPSFYKSYQTSARSSSSSTSGSTADTSHPLELPENEDTNDSSAAPHIPVLMEEIMGFFQDSNVRVYVDGTLGAGGHASQVVARHSELETLVGFDLDPLAHQLAGERLEKHGAHVKPVTVHPKTGIPHVVGEEDSTSSTNKVGSNGKTPPPTALLVRSNFSAMGDVLPHLSNPISNTAIYGNVDAMLLDLGISSMQIDLSERGFSFMRDGPLDMRMDPEALISAELAVNTWSEAQLGKIIKDYGEERYWKSIARKIASAREEAPILTTHQLVKAIGNPGGYNNSGGGRGGKGGGRGGGKGIHPATRTFQALRIAVNGELQSIAEAIPAAVAALAPGGRLAVITFHSLEDRIVKWAFRQAAGMAPTDEPLPSYCVPFDERSDGEALVKILTRRPVVPGEEEEKGNPRSRSAKLRVVERI
jgi:16S rRNA (cytosine1402-N4)-methyltransferase